MPTKTIKAELQLIGINPYVLLPDKILHTIFKQSGKEKGPIRIKGTVNGNPYTQTLVKYAGAWRLYINTTMLKNSPKRIGEIIELTVAFDPSERIVDHHPKLIAAFKKNTSAKKVFDTLPPSRQLEIVRYIANLKSDESIDKNVKKAIGFLLGKERFVGRDKLQ